MEKILISACLLGENTRYDGGNNYLPVVEKLKEKYDLLPFCPEVAGGLSIPREPCEIKGLDVVTKDGASKMKEYDLGARKALQACKLFGIRIAILNESSPSCGVRNIHDGHFNQTKIPGKGVTTRLLEENGIRCYSSFDDLSFLLEESEKKEKEYLSYEERVASLKYKKKGDKKKTFAKKRNVTSSNEVTEKKSFEEKEHKKSFHHNSNGKKFSKGKKSFGHGKKHFEKNGEKSFKKNDFKKGSFKGKKNDFHKGSKNFKGKRSNYKKSA